MPFFQWWYMDLALYEKDGYRTDWRLARTKIRTQLTADGIIKPKWKHELTLFRDTGKNIRTLSQYRPSLAGPQSLDLYIPSLRTAIEYQESSIPSGGVFRRREGTSCQAGLDQQKRAIGGKQGTAH